MASQDAFHPATSRVTPHLPARPWWTALALTLAWTVGSYALVIALILITMSGGIFWLCVGLLWLGAATGGWFVHSWWLVLVYSAPTFAGAVFFYQAATEMAAEYEQTGAGSLAPVAAFFIAIVCAVATLVLASTATGMVAASKLSAAHGQTAPDRNRGDVDADRRET